MNSFGVVFRIFNHLGHATSKNCQLRLHPPYIILHTPYEAIQIRIIIGSLLRTVLECRGTKNAPLSGHIQKYGIGTIMRNEINVYLYNDLNKYLQDYIKIKSQVSNGFTYRSLAMRLDGISHSQLFQIISGKKIFPLSLVSQFSSKVLKLDRKEKRYFNALVEINYLRMNNVPDKDLNLSVKELEKLRPLEIKHIEFNEEAGKPLVMIIFEMIGRKGVLNIADIRPEIFIVKHSQEEIRKAINFLISTGEVIIDEIGNLSRGLPHIMSHNDLPNKNIQAYHCEVSRYAADTISQVHVLEREFQSYGINISKSDLVKAKELIRNFSHEFAREMEVSPAAADSTYNLNIQFFPLTKDFI